MINEIRKDMKEFIKQEELSKVLYEVALMKKEVTKCIEKTEFDLRYNVLVKEIEKKFNERPTMKYV